MAQIDTLKILLQISDTSQDTLLTNLISVCGDEYKNRTHQTTVDETICNAMCVEKYNKLGNEGTTGGNFSGISETFESDYSEQVKALIRSKTRMVAL